VRRVADRLHVSGAFVTAETGKLVDRGLLEKRPNPRDRRGVLLSLTAAGRDRIEAVAPLIRAVNDRFFASLDGADFADVRRIMAAMVADSEGAVLAAASSRPPDADGL
jgi:DNA-binding MarR family transcriptional regulator